MGHIEGRPGRTEAWRCALLHKFENRASVRDGAAFADVARNKEVETSVDGNYSY